MVRLHFDSFRSRGAYVEFTAAGRDIGSGLTEAQCKCETLRLTGHGRRWPRENVEAINTIEAVHQSRLTHIWNHHSA